MILKNWNYVISLPVFQNTRAALQKFVLGITSAAQKDDIAKKLKKLVMDRKISNYPT